MFIVRTIFKISTLSSNMAQRGTYRWRSICSLAYHPEIEEFCSSEHCRDRQVVAVMPQWVGAPDYRDRWSRYDYISESIYFILSDDTESYCDVIFISRDQQHLCPSLVPQQCCNF